MDADISRKVCWHLPRHVTATVDALCRRLIAMANAPKASPSSCNQSALTGSLAVCACTRDQPLRLGSKEQMIASVCILHPRRQNLYRNTQRTARSVRDRGSLLRALLNCSAVPAAATQQVASCVNGETETSPATVMSTAVSVSSTQMTAAASGDFPRSESWDPLDRPSVDWPGRLAASRTSPGSSRDFALSGLARCSGGGSTCIKGLVSVKRLNSRGFLPVALFLQLGLMRSASQTNVMDGRSFC